MIDHIKRNIKEDKSLYNFITKNDIKFNHQILNRNNVTQHFEYTIDKSMLE